MRNKNKRRNEGRKPYQQNQSRFFSLLVPELRLIIYKQVLSHPRTLTHIAKFESPTGWKWAHQTCDEEADAPSKQSCCCGSLYKGVSQYLLDGESEFNQYIDFKNDGFLPLLGTCRRIYYEALPVLYGSNVFSFGSNTFSEHDPTPFTPLFAFHKRTPHFAWKAIRHLHLDATFQMHDRQQGRAPFLNYEHDTWRVWSTLYTKLGGLRLVTLRVDVFFAYLRPHECVEDVHDETLRRALEPLTKMAAKEFAVSFNVRVPEAVEKEFEDAGFTILFLKPRYVARWSPEGCKTWILNELL